jgi:hypothetical protein
MDEEGEDGAAGDDDSAVNEVSVCQLHTLALMCKRGDAVGQVRFVPTDDSELDLLYQVRRPSPGPVPSLYNAFGYIGTIFWELEWKHPIFCVRVLPKTPNASYADQIACAGFL